MTSLREAYNVGKALALYKFAEETELDMNTDNLTGILDILAKSEANEVPSNLDSGEDILDTDTSRVSKSVWGDKLDLEPDSAVGINV